MLKVWFWFDLGVQVEGVEFEFRVRQMESKLQ